MFTYEFEESNFEGLTPEGDAILSALKEGNNALAIALIAQLDSINKTFAPNNITVLMMAVFYNRIIVLRCLFVKKAINKIAMHTVFKNNLFTSKIILDSEIEVNKYAKNPAIKMLISKEPIDVTMATNNAWTAMCIAAPKKKPSPTIDARTHPIRQTKRRDASMPHSRTPFHQLQKTPKGRDSERGDSTGSYDEQRMVQSA